MPEIDCVTSPSKRCEAFSLGSFVDQSGRGVPQEVLCCKSCGHGVTLPLLDDVGPLYAGRNSQDFQPGVRGLSWYIKEQAFRIQAKRLMHHLGMTPKTVLDYGCGSGQFTRVLGASLPLAVVVGSDFFEQPPPELAGRPYMSFAQIDRRNERFDAVLALHVLEHHNSPGQLINQLMGLVAPGGRLVIEVPNIECLWSRIIGRNWDVWYVPFHRHHFSRRSLLSLIEAQGLAVERLEGVTVPSMGRSLANMLSLPKAVFCLLAGMVLHPVQILGERVSGQATALRAVVRRPRADC